ncbi:MAG: hypothetical protein ACE5JL_14810, partial [Dehalococcoidia bacterium]
TACAPGVPFSAVADPAVGVAGCGPNWHAESRVLMVTKMDIKVVKCRLLSVIYVPPVVARWEIGTVVNSLIFKLMVY